MARSKTIWVVSEKERKVMGHGWIEWAPGKILGTFTVKHEMIRTVARSSLLLSITIIERMPDGRLCESETFDDTEVKKLIEEEREWCSVDDFTDAYEKGK